MRTDSDFRQIQITGIDLHVKRFKANWLIALEGHNRQPTSFTVFSDYETEFEHKEDRLAQNPCPRDY